MIDTIEFARPLYEQYQRVAELFSSVDPGRPVRLVIDINWESGQASQVFQAPGGHYLAGEPAFVPDPNNPHRGAVICQLYRAEVGRSSFVIFDAFELERGPVARLELDSHMSFGFHSCFEQNT